MPKRPSKKAMEGAAVADPLWEVEHQGQATDSFDEIEEIEEAEDEEEEEEAPSPSRVR